MEKFWQWFTDHNEQLVMLNDLAEGERTALLDALQAQLTAYCDGLAYEMGEPTPNGRDLTFTAEGDTDLFRYVVELVDGAPDLDWWNFVAFRQPKGTQLRVRFDNEVFDTSKMWFEQLECEGEPDLLGLRIALPGCRPDDEDQQVGVYCTLEALLGEFDLATLLGYMETVEAPAEPFKSGFQSLDDLPRMVEWFKRKRDE